MSQKMRILLTGATGLIGKEVGKALSAAGHQVVAVSRSRAKAELELPFAAEIVEWDAQSPESLLGQPGLRPDEIDGVIHLLGENLAARRWSNEVKKQLIQSRLQSTQALVRALGAHARLKVWLQASAIGYYGYRELAEPATESSPKGEGFLSDLCQQWEGAISGLPPAVRRVYLRTGIVMSHRRGGPFDKMLPPILQGVGGSLGGGGQGMSLIHLEDEVRFILHALENPKVGGPYNLVCEQPIAQRMLTEKLCHRLHARMGPPAPTLALKVMFGEMAIVILQSLAIRSVRIRETGFVLRYPTVDSILDEVTSWHQDPLAAGKAAYVKYEEQFVPHPPEQVFGFFSAAENLERITPDFLQFRIRSMSTPSITDGTRIRYGMRVHRLPVEWETRIAQWDPPRRFVDVQEKGPYSLWYHEHTLRPVPGGTLIEDWVRYRLPLGKLGQWVGYLQVRSDVGSIFDYRRKMIGKEFLASSRA
jgi:uncharacterized protein (TIGR01777 family)